MTPSTTRTVATLAAFLLVSVVGVAAGARSVDAPSSCTRADPETCLYTSDLSFATALVEDVVLVDPARDDYRVPLRIRYPVGAPGPRPVVIWHHGGGPSERGNTRSEEWSVAMAGAGYVVVQPSRVLPDDVAPLRAECEANGFSDPRVCAQWVAQYRYGPQTTHFVIDRLGEIAAARPLLRGRFDVERIVVAGHSAGTATTLANAGARQQWRDGGPVYDETDDRPIAFLVASPMGPLYAGFNAGFDERTSFGHSSRPLLTLTGMGDLTGEPVPTRLAAWIASRPGDKPLVWDSEPGAVHETFNLRKCDTALQAVHCDWLESAGLAYLDAVVRRRPEAIDWLASDDFAVATGGAVQLIHR